MRQGSMLSVGTMLMLLAVAPALGATGEVSDPAPGFAVALPRT